MRVDTYIPQGIEGTLSHTEFLTEMCNKGHKCYPYCCCFEQKFMISSDRLFSLFKAIHTDTQTLQCQSFTYSPALQCSCIQHQSIKADSKPAQHCSHGVPHTYDHTHNQGLLFPDTTRLCVFFLCLRVYLW